MQQALLLASGVILLTDVLYKIPEVGGQLKKLAVWLAGFGVIIGILDIAAVIF